MVYGVILILIETPIFLRRARPGGPRLGVRQKAPWLVALGLVMVFVGAPLALVGVWSSKHPRNETLYIQDLLDWQCNANARGCALSTGLTKPYRDKIRNDPATYIAAGDKACAWLAGQPPLVFFSPRANVRQSQYVNHILGPGTGMQTHGWDSNQRDFDLYEASYAWRDLCPGTMVSRTGFPLRHWRKYE
jgi:hypothetical protein